MRQRFLVFAGALLLSSTSAWSQTKLVEKVTKKGDEIVIPYEKYVLPNGLTLIVHEDHSDPVVHVDVTYHVGSAREEIGKSGFAHFFEHMLFQGSDHVADEQHFKTVTEAGGTLNGSTNRDRTNYFETVPSNQLEKMLWLESDRMGYFLDAVTQKKFEVQRSTVKNERGQSYENRPYGQVPELYSQSLYPYGHPYSWLTIGYVEDLNRVDVNDLKNFFLRWYGPNNAALTIGGDVKTADVVKLVEKYFGSIPRGPQVDPVQVPAVALSDDRYVSYTDNYAKLPMLHITYPTVPDYNKDKAALQCLAQVLGQGRNSILYQQLTKKQSALQASANNYFAELSGEFTVQLTPFQGKTLADMEKLYRATLDTFEKRGVTDEDLAVFKATTEAQLLNSLQSVAGKMTQLAQAQYLTGNPNKIAEVLNLYGSVTKDDVMRVFNQYIKGKKAVYLSVTTKGQESMTARENNYKTDSGGYVKPDYGYAGLRFVKGKETFDRSRMPKSGPAPVLSVPKFWRKDMANGARIIGTENTEIPMLTLSISIPGGHLANATDLSKAGTASLFTELMNDDTKKHTAEQFAQELQKLGAGIAIISRKSDVVLTVNMVKKNIDQVLALVEERLLQPNFTESSFSRIKKRAIESLKAQKANPASVSANVFAKLNYGPNNILGLPETGTAETVENISLQDIEAYYENYITSMGAKVVVVGDITEAEMLPKLEFLNKLPKLKVPTPKVEPPLVADKAKVYLVDVPKSPQTDFRVGYATDMKYDPTGDYYNAVLANYTLGGGFNSRLNLNLREDKGWTYGAGTAFESDNQGSTFRFGSSIKGDATDSAMAEVIKEVKNYVANGITEDELQFMKNSMSLSEARSYETGSQKAAFISRILEYNLPPDYLTKQNKLLKNATKAQIDKAARAFIKPNQFNIVLVGDKSKIMEKVKKLGYEVIEVDASGKTLNGGKTF